MPKPVKKAVRKLKTPPKPKRPSDPNRAAHSQLQEHLARMGETVTPPHGDTFQEQLSAHMAALGRKGGKVSGARRMTNLTAKRRKAIAARAAAARWSNKAR